MTILHVSDFHYNKAWFDWLLNDAPPHDVVAMAGDMLDLTSPTPHNEQIAWVTAWLKEYPGAMVVCSGFHDLEWSDDSERWTPAYWLRNIGNPRVWTDGQRVTWGGVSIFSIGCTTRPKGAEADVWVVHVPPAQSAVALRATGGDGGDAGLASAVRRHAPRILLSGHVHNPMQWHDRFGSTLCLNPGRHDADCPNHLLVNTDLMRAQLVSGGRQAGDAANPANTQRREPLTHAA